MAEYINIPIPPQDEAREAYRKLDNLYRDLQLFNNRIIHYMYDAYLTGEAIDAEVMGDILMEQLDLQARSHNL